MSSILLKINPLFICKDDYCFPFGVHGYKKGFFYGYKNTHFTHLISISVTHNSYHSKPD